MYGIIEIFDTVKLHDLPDRIKSISKYLMDGYQYAANIKDEEWVRTIDIRQHLELLNTLHICATHMIGPEDNRYLAMILDDKTRVNLEPMFDFLDLLDEEGKGHEDFEELDRVLKNYLNDTNAREYKKASKVVAELASILDSLYFEIQNREC